MCSGSKTGASDLIGSERRNGFSQREIRTQTEVDYSRRRGKRRKGGGSETCKESDLTALTLSADQLIQPRSDCPGGAGRINNQSAHKIRDHFFRCIPLLEIA